MRPYRTGRMPSRLFFLSVCHRDIPSPDAPGLTIEHWRGAVARYLIWGRGGRSRIITHYSTTPSDLWDWVTSMSDSHHPTYLYGYDLGRCLTLGQWWELMDSGRFDLTDAAGELLPNDTDDDPDHNSKRGFICDHDPPIIINGYLDEKRIVLLDTRNYVRSPLEDIGQSLGIRRLPLPPPWASH